MPAVEYRILYSDGREVTKQVELPGDNERRITPTAEQRKRWAIVRELTQVIIGADNEVEHVNVWHDGKYLDMFVDEQGVLKALPLNQKATAIYRANVLAHEPDPGPDRKSVV